MTSSTPESPSSPTPTQNDLAALQALYLKIKKLKEAVAANKLSYYRPHDKQRAFHAAEASDIRVVLGGNRSGKTTCGAAEAIAHALGYRPWLSAGDPNYLVHLPSGDPIPVPNIGRIVANTFEINIVQTIHPKIMEWAPADAIKNTQKNPRGVPIRYDFANGSTIYLMSYDQDVDSFEGTNGHWFWCDEPPPQRIFNGLRRGLVDFGGHCWLTMTPLSEPWTNKVLVAKANQPDGRIWMRRMSIWDNAVSRGGSLPDKTIHSVLADFPEDERESREKGTALHLTGLVFHEWRDEPPFWLPFPGEIPRHWPRAVIIDPHPRKPIAVLWLATSPDNQVFAYRELFDKKMTTVEQVAYAIHEAEGWIYAGQERDRVTGRMKDKWRRGPDTEPVAIRIIDTSANEHEKTSGETVAEQFSRFGIHCTDAFKRNRDAGLQAIHAALRLQYEWSEPGLVVYDTCPTVRDNFMNFVYDRWGNSRMQGTKDEKQTVIKANDDFIDCIRYYYQYRLTYMMLKRMVPHGDDEERGASLGSRTLRRGGMGRPDEDEQMGSSLRGNIGWSKRSSGSGPLPRRLGRAG